MMPEDCREKIMSDEYVDFIWKSDYSVRELERLYPQYCVQILNDFYAVFYVESRILEQNRLPYSYEVFPILYTLLENENLEKSGIMQLLEHSVL